MLYRFDGYVLDTVRRELLRETILIPLQPQVFDLLVFLVENRDRVVTKEDLIASVWHGRIVSESTLTSRINAARNAIGDSGQKQCLIRTVRRKGFRFVGDIAKGEDQPQARHGQSARLATVPGQGERPSIAVLPFDDLSDDPGQDHFPDGISEDIITALSRLRWFFVVARNSSFIYKGRAVHLDKIAEELGVDYVVEGSVRKVGNRVRITAQLNDVSTGSHIWADHFDREIDDVFQIQDEITESVIAAIEPQLYRIESVRAREKPTESLDAWELVMRALSHYWRVTRHDNEQAQNLLEQAIRIDPEYGQALGVLANSHMFGAHMGWEDLEAATPVAEPSAMRAIGYDNEDAWAHTALGHVYLLTRRFDESLAEYRQALYRNPNFALAQAYYGLCLSYSGQWREAEYEVQRAIRLSPHDPFAAYYYGIASYAQFVGENYEKAIALAQEALRRRGDFVGAHRVLTASAGMIGDKDRASDALAALMRVQPNLSLDWISGHLPIRHADDLARYMAGFKKAGLK